MLTELAVEGHRKLRGVVASHSGRSQTRWSGLCVCLPPKALLDQTPDPVDSVCMCLPPKALLDQVPDPVNSVCMCLPLKALLDQAPDPVDSV